MGFIFTCRHPEHLEESIQTLDPENSGISDPVLDRFPALLDPEPEVVHVRSQKLEPVSGLSIVDGLSIVGGISIVGGLSIVAPKT